MELHSPSWDDGKTFCTLEESLQDVPLSLDQACSMSLSLATLLNEFSKEGLALNFLDTDIMVLDSSSTLWIADWSSAASTKVSKKKTFFPQSKIDTSNDRPVSKKINGRAVCIAPELLLSDLSKDSNVTETKTPMNADVYTLGIVMYRLFTSFLGKRQAKYPCFEASEDGVLAGGFEAVVERALAVQEKRTGAETTEKMVKITTDLLKIENAFAELGHSEGSASPFFCRCLILRSLGIPREASSGQHARATVSWTQLQEKISKLCGLKGQNTPVELEGVSLHKGAGTAEALLHLPTSKSVLAGYCRPYKGNDTNFASEFRELILHVLVSSPDDSMLNEKLAIGLNLSEWSEVTLSDLGKSEAEIPKDTTHFAFAYPMDGAELPQEDANSSLSPLMALITGGGYVYVSLTSLGCTWKNVGSTKPKPDDGEDGDEIKVEVPLDENDQNQSNRHEGHKHFELAKALAEKMETNTMTVTFTQEQWNAFEIRKPSTKSYINIKEYCKSVEKDTYFKPVEEVPEVLAIKGLEWLPAGYNSGSSRSENFLILGNSHKILDTTLGQIKREPQWHTLSDRAFATKLFSPFGSQWVMVEPSDVQIGTRLQNDKLADALRRRIYFSMASSTTLPHKPFTGAEMDQFKIPVDLSSDSYIEVKIYSKLAEKLKSQRGFTESEWNDHGIRGLKNPKELPPSDAESSTGQSDFMPAANTKLEEVKYICRPKVSYELDKHAWKYTWVSPRQIKTDFDGNAFSAGGFLFYDTLSETCCAIPVQNDKLEWPPGSNKIPVEIRTLVSSMLMMNPDMRPDISLVLEHLRDYKKLVSIHTTLDLHAGHALCTVSCRVTQRRMCILEARPCALLLAQCWR